MYTTTGERGERIGLYSREDKDQFLRFAHSHTMSETINWLHYIKANLDIMYTDGRPDAYDKWTGECAGVKCTNGYLWN